MAALRQGRETASSLGAHRAHQLDEDDIAWADLIVTMEASQVRFIRRSHPDAAARTATIAALAKGLGGDGPLGARIESMDLDHVDPCDDDDVVDPAGKDDDAYEQAADTLRGLCGTLASHLVG